MGQRIEPRIRLSKCYTMHKHTDTKLITSDKLTEFFEDHLKEKHVELQPEVTNPDDFPHILPPDDINISSDIPSEAEVQEAIKRLKNGKCQGTDKVYGEELKYNTSGRFMVYFLLLLTTIWTTFVLPSSWLVSSITCLFKTMDQEVMLPIIVVFLLCPLAQKSS